ncbi:MAG: ATP-binding protein [Candidatus Omnitrophica bacterium]|nr:ATP-binding protein [Candidatus Omnitrophota bacterium]
MANTSIRYIPRILDLPAALKNKSIFLFGPRQTGKSTLIGHTLSDCRVYNLLESDTFLKLNRTPQALRQECGPKDKIIVIDEIQKLPSLLDEVHLLIEGRGIHFLLTGSSARKLRRSGANLLGGRAREKHLFPFSYRELGHQFDLTRALNYGLLPSIYLSDSPEEDLESYSGAYLKTEIADEGATRNIPAFSRFLEVAAICNGQMINYTEIANDAQVPRTTVHEYFQILTDTLLAYELPAWKKSFKRKPISTSKFYFFDVGVARFMQNRKVISPGSKEYGECFETFIFHELKVYSEYKGKGCINYWRSTSGYEVDFIVNDEIAIEVKASANISSGDINGLKAIREEHKLKKYMVICFVDRPRLVDGINIMPWKMALDNLWSQ